ncbi:hypothetical protein HK104_008836 [Borealophlyctis nickersoniae]|nr:hypothetical protein HK104_008836 [Borealophlyctis nickersoniae]
MPFPWCCAGASPPNEQFPIYSGTTPPPAYSSIKPCTHRGLHAGPSRFSTPYARTPHHPTYNLTNVTRSTTTIEADLTFASTSPSPLPQYGPDIRDLSLTIDLESEFRVKVTIQDKERARWVVPDQVFPRPGIVEGYDASVRLYDVDLRVEGSEGGDVGRRDVVRVTRFGEKPDDEVPVFEFAIQDLVFKPQYIEFSNTGVGGEGSDVYGLGEMVGSFRRNMNGSCVTIFTRDAASPPNENLYGAHPMYMEIRPDGQAHGVVKGLIIDHEAQLYFFGPDPSCLSHSLQFFLNSNPMDIHLNPNTITYTPIGGILEFYILLGPTPISVCQQYSTIIHPPAMMPYWSLGFHQCRWGYERLEDVKTVVEKFKANQIPLDGVWIDIDYMDKYKDFTFDEDKWPVAEVRKFVDNVRENGQKVVMIVDPGIKIEAGHVPYDTGIAKNVFLKNERGTDFIGKVWPGKVKFPDFFHPATQDWWTECFREWLDQVDLDGIWIDMNELANFGNGEIHEDGFNNPVDLHQLIGSTDSGPTLELPDGDLSLNDDDTTNVGSSGTTEEDTIFPIETGVKSAPASNQPLYQFDYANPPYRINNAGTHLPLFSRTTSMTALHHTGIREYDAHNLYGHMESLATHKTITTLHPTRRPFILTRSTFAGTGRVAAHWLGDNHSTWESMKYSIPGTLAFQMFGIHMVGPDIGGFNGTPSETLLTRWMALGAFYPFSRNHNITGAPGQEPYVHESTVRVSRRYLAMRYAMVPYWYTLFYLGHKEGTPVLRPLCFLYPPVKDVRGVETQFMIGDHVLVSPCVDPEGPNRGYIPPTDVWYSAWTGARVPTDQTLVTFADDVDTTPVQVHYRGGGVLPLHSKPGLTLKDTRLGGYDILVALSSDGKATGQCYLDDGETRDPEMGVDAHMVTFDVREGTLVSSGVSYRTDGTGWRVPDSWAKVNKIKILGVEKKAGWDGRCVAKGRGGVDIEGRPRWEGDVLEIEVDGVRIDEDFEIRW